MGGNLHVWDVNNFIKLENLGAEIMINHLKYHCGYILSQSNKKFLYILHQFANMTLISRGM